MTADFRLGGRDPTGAVLLAWVWSDCVALPEDIMVVMVESAHDPVTVAYA